MHWRTGDLVRAIPISRDDLNQAISRNGFRPDHTPKPGTERWYGWRDVVAIAASQELRKIGYGPAIAFGLVQEHLSPFLRSSVEHPRQFKKLLWLIEPAEGTPAKKHRCRFLHRADPACLAEASKTGCIIVNLEHVTNRILADLAGTKWAG